MLVTGRMGFRSRSSTRVVSIMAEDGWIPSGWESVGCGLDKNKKLGRLTAKKPSTLVLPGPLLAQLHSPLGNIEVEGRRCVSVVSRPKNERRLQLFGAERK